jgi:hypothetical protein
VDGSAANFSGKDRRLLLFQYRAPDAWPLLGLKDGINKFDELLLAGAPFSRAMIGWLPRLGTSYTRQPLP